MYDLNNNRFLGILYRIENTITHGFILDVKYILNFVMSVCFEEALQLIQWKGKALTKRSFSNTILQSIQIRQADKAYGCEKVDLKTFLNFVKIIK